MEMSVIIPVYNEQNNIVHTIYDIDHELKKILINKKV